MMTTKMNALTAFLVATAISAAGNGASAREPGTTRFDAEQSSEETGQTVSKDNDIVTGNYRVNAGK
jgi:hypothetical protein